MASERDGQRFYVPGHPGQGKTNLLQVLTMNMPRLIVIDPKHSWRMKRKTLGLYIASDLADFLKVLKEAWNSDGNFRIVFEPEADEEEAQGSDIGKLFINLHRRYLENPAMEKTCIAIDEAAEVLPNPVSKKYRGLLQCCSMGREIGIDVFGGTQYPVDVSKKFQRYADRALILPVGGAAADVVSNLAAGDRRVLDAVDQLQPHHYISLNRLTGQFEQKNPVQLIPND